MSSFLRTNLLISVAMAALVLAAVQYATLAPKAEAVGEVVAIGSLSTNVGQQGVVPLQALNIGAPGLGAWTIDIVYNPAIVTVKSCAVVPVYSICNPAFNTVTIRDTGADPFGLLGNVLLANITFTCNTSGVSPLTVSIDVLADATIGNPQPINATTQNGFFACGATPTPTISGTPAASATPPPPSTPSVAATPTPCSGSCPPKVYIGSISRNVGQLGTVPLLALNMAPPGLGAWTIDIEYNPSIVAVKSCIPTGPALGVCNPAFNSITIRDVGATAVGLLGNVPLADITFTCNQHGTSPLTITIDILADATIGNPQPINAGIVNGSVTCSGGPGPALGGVADYPDLSGGRNIWPIALLAAIVATLALSAAAVYTRRRG